MEVFQLCVITGEELSTSCCEKMPSAFTLKGVVHKITASPASVPHLPLPLTDRAEMKSPQKKDMPPFKLKSVRVIRGLQHTTLIMAVKMADEGR